MGVVITYVVGGRAARIVGGVGVSGRFATNFGR